MKLIGCDRCPAIFPCGDGYAVLRIHDSADSMALLREPAEHHLCGACRADLDAFLARRDSPPPNRLRPPERPPVPVVDVAADDPDPAPRDRRAGWPDRVPERTCEICGRVGKQRFIETATGWRCAPTAVKCPGNKHASDIPAKEFPANVTSEPEQPAPPPPASAPPAPGVTARCKDCTRTWNLTGFILEKAIELHELKHGHIVETIGQGAA